MVLTHQFTITFDEDDCPFVPEGPVMVVCIYWEFKTRTQARPGGAYRDSACLSDQPARNMHGRFGVTQTNTISPRRIPAGYRERIDATLRLLRAKLNDPTFVRSGQ
jgi:hypothetical protein